jgi:signal transduction histidine kinase/CHASE3 domain sensor protein
MPQTPHASSSPAGRPDVARAVTRSIRFGIGALAAIAATVVLITVVDYRFAAWADDAREVTRLSRTALRQAVDRETGVRGFLLTGDSAALAPELAARAALPAVLDSLERATAGDPAQHRTVRAARRALERWEREFATPALSGSPSEAARWRATLAGKTLFDPMRERMTELVDAESAQYAHRKAENFLLSAVLAPLLLLSEAAAALLVIMRMGHRSHRDAATLELQTREARQLAADLAHANHALEEARDRAERETAGKEETLAVLNAALASSPVGIGFFGPDLRYSRVNPALAALIGSGEDHILGRTLGEVTPAHAEAEALLARVRDTRQPFVDVEFRAGAAAGSGPARFGRASFYPIVAGGRFVGAGMMVVETTDHRRLHDQLVQSQKMEAVGQLAGGIAHDFNNLLTAILGYADMALLGLAEGDPLRDDVSEIAQAGRRAAGLTRQLLTFSRRQATSPDTLSLNALLADFGRMLRRVIGEDVRVEERLDPALGLVRADRGQMEQVVMNLAVNARDAMPRGGRLVIETRNVQVTEAEAARHVKLRPGPHVLLSVADEGSGMDAATLEHIFEPFFTTKPRGHGTGLGLSTVYGIVDQAGGAISVESEPGRGTTFHVHLPRVDPEGEGTAEGAAGGPGRGTGTVLLVEDDEAVRQSVGRMAEALGYRVLAASGAAEAQAACAAHGGAVDLVLADLVMPGASGPELVEQLRATCPAARVLFMSGYTSDAVLNRGVIAHGTSFLPKPFTLDELGAAIRGALEGPPGGLDPADG